MYICKSFMRNQLTLTKSESEKMRHLDNTYYCIAFINVYLYYFYCKEWQVQYLEREECWTTASYIICLIERAPWNFTRLQTKFARWNNQILRNGPNYHTYQHTSTSSPMLWMVYNVTTFLLAASQPSFNSAPHMMHAWYREGKSSRDWFLF